MISKHAKNAYVLIVSDTMYAKRELRGCNDKESLMDHTCMWN